jgi:hypothetical protein
MALPYYIVIWQANMKKYELGKQLLFCMDFVVRGCEFCIDLRNIKFVVNWLIQDNLIEPR